MLDAQYAAEKAVETQAVKTFSTVLEVRVAAYTANPRLLDGISLGLSKQSPDRMRTTINKLIAGELPLRPFRDESTAINLRAASIYAERLGRRA